MRYSLRIVLPIMVLMCIPYPDKVFPECRIRLINANGSPYSASPIAHWEGINNVHHCSGDIQFSNLGVLNIPRRVIWASGFHRLLVALGEITPWFPEVTTGARIEIDIPPGYSLDSGKMGAIVDQNFLNSPIRQWTLASGRIAIQIQPNGSSAQMYVDVPYSHEWDAPVHINIDFE